MPLPLRLITLMQVSPRMGLKSTSTKAQFAILSQRAIALGQLLALGATLAIAPSLILTARAQSVPTYVTPLTPGGPDFMPVPSPATGIPSLSPISLPPGAEAPSLSSIPIPIYPNRLPHNPLNNSLPENVLSIEIPCNELADIVGQKLEICQKFLALHQEIDDRRGIGATLNNIGLVYHELGDYPKALDYYQQALEIHQSFNDRATIGATLNNLGLTYHELGEYAKALDYYQQALELHQQLNRTENIGRTLNNLGELHRQLGQYPEALAYYQQALAAMKGTDDARSIGKVNHNLGMLYEQQGNSSEALNFYQQALAIRQKINDKPGLAATLNNLGLFYNERGDYTQALTLLEQSLGILQEIGDRVGIGNTLDSIGTVQQSLGNYEQSWTAYNEALTILRATGNRGIERITLGNIGALLEQQKQSELAILFYKQSVNLTEEIRQDLQSLPQEQQEAYTQTVAKVYRNLADVLLQCDRVLEAQQVLELLKLQEVKEYLGQVRGSTQTQLDLLPAEQQISAEYQTIQDRAIALGKELYQLEQIPSEQRTISQQQRILELKKSQQLVLQEFERFIHHPAIASLTQQLYQTTDGESLNLKILNTLQGQLQTIDQNAAILYPLILEDRLELVLVTPYSPPIHRTVQVKREELNRAILEFRTALTDRRKSVASVQQSAETLYNWLIRPLEADLKQANAETLIYAPDGQLRYIPLAALFDGKQWLIERFRINNITAVSLTHLGRKSPSGIKVLAGAFSQGNYNVQIGDRQYAFAGLPYAAREVKILADTIPQTTALIDAEFNPQATVPFLNQYNIVHFATHAAFVTGRPEDSFILFGNGDRVTLPEVETWALPNVDLVVLSACQTAVGGLLGDGKEILGFGYQIQQTGAKAAIASLWVVDDGGTQTLMNAFYHALQSRHLTKAEALRQAQLALIRSDSTASAQQRGLRFTDPFPISSLPASDGTRLSHPYYWAPFILIGNGF